MSARTDRRIPLLWLLGLAAAGVLLAQTWTRAARPGGIDLTTYLAAARAVASGMNPYELPVPFPYLYPLFLAFALIPLTVVPEGVSVLAWSGASIAALVWSVRETITAAYPSLRHQPLTPFLAIFFVVVFPVIQSNVRNGQVNFIVLALCVYSLKSYTSARLWRSTFLLGTAVAIKIVPALQTLFSIRRGDWRTGAGALLIALLLCVVPLVLFDGSLLAFQTAHMIRLVTGGFGSGPNADPIDFSAGGILMSIAPLGSPALLRMAGAVFIAAAALAIDRGRTDDVSAFAVYLTAIPLISPKSEIHHLAFALPAAALVLAPYWFRLGNPPPFLFAGLSAVCYGAGIAFRPVSGLAFFASLVTLGWAASKRRS